jgi:hypothetical protein
LLLKVLFVVYLLFCLSALVTWCGAAVSRSGEIEALASKTGYRKLHEDDGAAAGASNAANLSTFGLYGTLESAMGHNPAN